MPAPTTDERSCASACTDRTRQRHIGKEGTDRLGFRASLLILGCSRLYGRVREVARRDKGARFTALLHHVTVSRLRAAYWAISPQAAPGVDGVTWMDYGRNLEARLADLHQRVQSGRYRATPSRRAYIPKADGRLRPLGIASLARLTNDAISR